MGWPASAHLFHSLKKLTPRGPVVSNGQRVATVVAIGSKGDGLEVRRLFYQTVQLV